jgi:uncharacterized protein (DUF169 family)
MANEQIIETIKNVLGVKKEPVGLKVWKEEPQDIPKYEGRAFPGVCGQIGEVLESGETFHTNVKNQMCTGGVVACGVAPRFSGEQSVKVVKFHLKREQNYKDLDTAIHYQDKVDELIPAVGEKNAALQIALFKDIGDPDLVLIFCTPGAADILNRTYCYAFGEPIQGFGGNGGCPLLIQYPYVTKKPSFSYSDVAWRKYIGLADEELTVSVPYPSLASLVENLPDVAERYRKFGEGMGEGMEME